MIKFSKSVKSENALHNTNALSMESQSDIKLDDILSSSMFDDANSLITKNDSSSNNFNHINVNGLSSLSNFRAKIDGLLAFVFVMKLSIIIKSVVDAKVKLDFQLLTLIFAYTLIVFINIMILIYFYLNKNTINNRHAKYIDMLTIALGLLMFYVDVYNMGLSNEETIRLLFNRLNNSEITVPQS